MSYNENISVIKCKKKIDNRDAENIPMKNIWNIFKVNKVYSN